MFEVSEKAKERQAQRFKKKGWQKKKTEKKTYKGNDFTPQQLQLPRDIAFDVKVTQTHNSKNG